MYVNILYVLEGTITANNNVKSSLESVNMAPIWNKYVPDHGRLAKNKVVGRSGKFIRKEGNNCFDWSI